MQPGSVSTCSPPYSAYCFSLSFAASCSRLDRQKNGCAAEMNGFTPNQLDVHPNGKLMVKNSSRESERLPTVPEAGTQEESEIERVREKECCKEALRRKVK